MDECWIVKRPDSYWRVTICGVRIKAHRYAWEWVHGPIPDGHEVHHECRNKGCVNPDHLSAIDRIEHRKIHADNLRAAQALWVSGQRAATHCQRGHEFTPENTKVAKSRPGTRQCRECLRAANRRSMFKIYWAKKAAA